ncbi:hypothetical protein GCM10027592_57160 [Spirosoma flavus]
MKIQSRFFVLFLVAFTFVSTHSWAQSYSLGPATEPEASQDAHRLGEEIQTNQPVVTEAQKGANRSLDAMHWTAVNVHGQSQLVPVVSKRLLDDSKEVPFTIRIDKSVEEPMKALDKPAAQRL